MKPAFPLSECPLCVSTDLLIVDGDVLADITLLEDRARFLAVVHGRIVKAGRLANQASE